MIFKSRKNSPLWWNVLLCPLRLHPSPTFQSSKSYRDRYFPPWSFPPAFFPRSFPPKLFPPKVFFPLALFHHGFLNPKFFPLVFPSLGIFYPRLFQPSLCSQSLKPAALEHIYLTPVASEVSRGRMLNTKQLINTNELLNN